MRSDEQMNEEWNEQHCKYVQINRDNGRITHEAASFRNNRMADYCESVILKAKEAYYDGTPIMTDVWYDKIEDNLRILRPNSKMLEKVGS